MSYIISNGKLIAKTSAFIKSGQAVKWSFHKTKSGICPTRPNSLVNAEEGVISNARKWDNTLLKSTKLSNVIDSSGLYLELYCY